MRQPNQVLQFNDRELELFRSIFKGNDDLIFALRKLLLQFELTDMERNYFSVFSEEVLLLLKKVFLPDLLPDDPLFQMTDLVLTLKTDMDKYREDEIQPYFKAKQIEMDYLSQQLSLLTKESQKIKINFKDLSNLKDSNAYSNVLARNWLLSHVDTGLQRIKYMSETETPNMEKDAVKRLKNSLK